MNLLCNVEIQKFSHRNSNLCRWSFNFLFLWGLLTRSVNMQTNHGASLVAQLVKNPPANSGDPGSNPGSERSLGEGNGNPLKYSCMENPMDRGDWQVIVHGVSKSRTWLSDQEKKKMNHILRMVINVGSPVSTPILTTSSPSPHHTKKKKKKTHLINNICFQGSSPLLLFHLCLGYHSNYSQSSVIPSLYISTLSHDWLPASTLIIARGDTQKVAASCFLLQPTEPPAWFAFLSTA